MFEKNNNSAFPGITVPVIIQYSSVYQAGQSQNVLECSRKNFPLKEDKLTKHL